MSVALMVVRVSLFELFHLAYEYRRNDQRDTKMKPWRRRFIAVVAFCAISIALVGPTHANSIEGKIKSLSVRASDGLHILVVEGAPAGRAACAANQDYYMIADEHSDAGKAQMAILLSAYMSGKSVAIEGTGTCTRWVDGEDILIVTLR